MEAVATFTSDYELERGKPMPSLEHARLQNRLVKCLEACFGLAYEVLPEVSLALSGRSPVPDVVVFELAASAGAEATAAATAVLPVLALEILSPSQSINELLEKAELYLRAGINSCWIILPGLGNVSVSTVPGVYQTFNRNETLRDPGTGIELALSQVFG